MAAANEPAIRAIVSDSAFADVLPSIERDVPAQGHVPAWLTSGGMVVAWLVYGVDYFHIRPADVIASISSRPIFLIQGTEDNKNHRDTPPSHMYILAAAALSAPDANVQTWFVPGATHAQVYHMLGRVYFDRLVEFYTAAIGPDTSES